MVKLNKRPVSPKPISNENDYRSNPNFPAISEDCFSKCYICEHKSSTLNIEHLVPHKGDPALKYDWNNLFLSCGHCNNIKLGNYDKIINPSKIDPEDYIGLTLTIEDLKSEVLVEVLSVDEITEQTAKLLRYVYNGGTTDIKEVECANLRNAISNCVVKFHQYIKGFKEEPGLGYDVIIEKEISRSAEFASFKRKIVRDDKELSARFEKVLA